LGFLDRGNDDWSAETTYGLGDEVWSGGDDWKSLAAKNTENEPGEESEWWEKLGRQDLSGTVMALFEIGAHLVAVTTTAIYRLWAARTTWVEVTGDG